MKKYLFGAGTLVLAIAAVIAVKATTLRAATAAYVSYGVNGCTLLTTAASALFSNTAGTFAATLLSAGGTQHGVYSNSICSTPTYFRPE